MLQATFMRALLTTAYHFHSWGNITFVKRLGEPPAEVLAIAVTWAIHGTVSPALQSPPGGLEPGPRHRLGWPGGGWARGLHQVGPGGARWGQVGPGEAR